MQDFNALSNIQFGKDYVIFSINPNIYSLSIVKKAALAMIKKACVILDGDPKREILVEIRKETINQKANEIKKKELQRLAEEFSRLLLQQKD